MEHSTSTKKLQLTVATSVYTVVTFKLLKITKH